MSYKCPVESCGKEMGTITAMRAHITGSSGEHKGLSGSAYSEAELRKEPAVDGAGSSEGDKAESSPESEGAAQGRSGAGEGGPAFPVNEESGEESNAPEGEVELPCGHESYDPAEAPHPPFRAECETCGDSWVVE